MISIQAFSTSNITFSQSYLVAVPAADPCTGLVALTGPDDHA